MTIQTWLVGEPEFQRQAQAGFISKLAQGQISNTVTIGAATLAPTDSVVVQTNSGACAIKLLGGADVTVAGNTNPNGPCLPGDTMIIANHSGQNLTIFPNNSLGTLKNNSAGTGVLIATGLTAYLFYFGGDNWAMNAS
jgi:hypothetical protein